MQEEILDIVDKDDNVIGQNTRSEYKINKTLHRVVCIILKNGEGKILLQKRSASCNMPWHWDISAGGHVSSGQSYDEAVLRELFEELWVKCDLILKSKELRKKPGWHEYFRALYTGEYDWEMKLEDWEVERVEFFSLEEIRSLIANW